MAVLLASIADRKSGPSGSGPLRSFLLATGLALAASMTACAPARQYLGIDLTATPMSDAQAELRSLARDAKTGNKYAQLQLGIRFEDGNGVPRDHQIARKLYSAAANDSGGAMWIYSPPVGSETIGRVIAIKQGAVVTGLIEARYRLERLNEHETIVSNVKADCKSNLIGCFIKGLEASSTTISLEPYIEILRAQDSAVKSQSSITYLPCENAQGIYGHLFDDRHQCSSEVVLFRIRSDQPFDAYPKLDEIRSILGTIPSDSLDTYQPPNKRSSALIKRRSDIFNVTKLIYRLDNYILIFNFYKLNNRLSDLEIVYFGA